MTWNHDLDFLFPKWWKYLDLFCLCYILKHGIKFLYIRLCKKKSDHLLEIPDETGHTCCFGTFKHCQSNFILIIQVTTKGLGAKMQSLSLTGTSELSMCSTTHKGFNICSEYLNATLAMNSGTNMPFRFETLYFSLYFEIKRNFI